MARSDDKWMCWYGCHVTQGAYKMVWIFAIVNILGVLLCLLPILCGHFCGKRSHRMYLPFLSLFAISTVYAFFEILYFVLQRILMFKSPDSIYVMFGLSLKEYENIIGSSTGEFALFILSMIALLAFWCWVYSIVFRAYKFTKQIGGDGTSNDTKMPI
uniref:Uncharacterized protein n=1 Tax=Globodera rostochiensis TaxID=31243 RepID=A0A914HLU5_GLORO